MSKIFFSAFVACDGDGVVCRSDKFQSVSLVSNVPLTVADVVRFARSKGWAVTQLSGSGNWRFRCNFCRVISRNK